MRVPPSLLVSLLLSTVYGSPSYVAPGLFHGSYPPISKKRPGFRLFRHHVGRRRQGKSSLSPVCASQTDGMGDNKDAKIDVIGSTGDATGLDALTLYEHLVNCDDRTIRSDIAKSLEVFGQAFRLYGPRSVFVSFNGGKDAVVIMHLARAALAKHCVDNQLSPDAHKLRVIYFLSRNEFPEIRKFVETEVERYNLDMQLHAKDFVSGLKACISGEAEERGEKAPHLAFVLGTRKGDPNCGVQKNFEPSSSWMPAFMRVNPILNWDYGQVWKFLRWSKLPYPSLYDKGYTSLGGTHDSWPNPHLRTPDGTFLPAHLLSDWTLERAGRTIRRASDMECELQDADTKFNSAEARTVGLVVVGDEILKGRTSDTNTGYAMAKFKESGLKVKRVAVVADQEDDIVEELRRQVSMCDVVVTSGGLGPTHDDVTLYAVARALGQAMTQNAQMMKLIRTQKAKRSPDPDAEISLTPAEEKMATLPLGSQLRTPPGRPGGWPVLQCGRVFILPGVPEFFEEKLDTICASFLPSRGPTALRRISLGLDELQIVDALNACVSEHTEVTFGSYPFHGEGEVRTVVTVEGDDDSAVTLASEDFVTRVEQLCESEEAAVLGVDTVSELHTSKTWRTPHI